MDESHQKLLESNHVISTLRIWHLIVNVMLSKWKGRHKVDSIRQGKFYPSLFFAWGSTWWLIYWIALPPEPHLRQEWKHVPFVLKDDSLILLWLSNLQHPKSTPCRMETNIDLEELKCEELCPEIFRKSPWRWWQKKQMRQRKGFHVDGFRWDKVYWGQSLLSSRVLSEKNLYNIPISSNCAKTCNVRWWIFIPIKGIHAFNSLFKPFSFSSSSVWSVPVIDNPEDVKVGNPLKTFGT